jgi:hypothetical protein
MYKPLEVTEGDEERGDVSGAADDGREAEEEEE